MGYIYALGLFTSLILLLSVCGTTQCWYLLLVMSIAALHACVCLLPFMLAFTIAFHACICMAHFTLVSGCTVTSNANGAAHACGIYFIIASYTHPQ